MLSTPYLLLADELPPNIPRGIREPGQLLGMLRWVLNFIWIALGIIVVIMLLYAGFKFITASGDTDSIDKAKEMVKYSLIGVVVMVLAGGVVQLIENIVSEGITGA